MTGFLSVVCPLTLIADVRIKRMKIRGFMFKFFFTDYIIMYAKFHTFLEYSIIYVVTKMFQRMVLDKYFKQKQTKIRSLLLNLQ